jgi:hypothetical protein
MLHERTEGGRGPPLAAILLAGHPDPERFVAEFSGSERPRASAGGGLSVSRPGT